MWSHLRQQYALGQVRDLARTLTSEPLDTRGQPALPGLVWVVPGGHRSPSCPVLHTVEVQLRKNK